MALFDNAPQPMWPMEQGRFSSSAERNLRDLSHVSTLVFAFTAVAAGILAGVALSANFGIRLTASLIVVVILFPLLCGWLARERWRVNKLEAQIKAQRADSGSPTGRVECRDDTPLGILIVSPDLTVRFANMTFLQRTFQEPEEVVGWKVPDVLLAEGIEDRVKSLLGHPDPAASCCFNAFMRIGLAGGQPVHITMTRIAPQQGEDRVLVVVEDLLQRYSPRAGLPMEGYVC